MRSKRERIGKPSALTNRAQKAVWVDLRVLYPADPSSTTVLPEGLDLEEVVPGGLWKWVRTSRGAWMGVVTFHLTYLDGRSERFAADRQLVPAHALRPR